MFSWHDYREVCFAPAENGVHSLLKWDSLATFLLQGHTLKHSDRTTPRRDFLAGDNEHPGYVQLNGMLFGDRGDFELHGKHAYASFSRLVLGAGRFSQPLLCLWLAWS